MHAGLPERFASGTLWTGAGFIVFAIAGVLLNILVAASHGAAGLGMFNLVMVVYTLASQVSVLGVHNSVVRYVAIQDRDHHDVPTLLVGALLITLVLGSMVGLAVWWAAEPYATATGTAGVAPGLRLVAPALVLFALNKVLAAGLNGERRMRAFALSQMLRSITLVGGVAVMVLRDWPVDALPTAFLIAEGTVFIGLAVPRIPTLTLVDRARLGGWVRTHTSFGLRGFLGGLMVEANTRVDILMLGFLTDAVTVGLYSFASMFAVGLHSLMMVVKQNVNPVISERWVARAHADIRALIRTVRRFSYPGTAVASLAIIGVFPMIAGLLGEEASRDSTIMLAILLVGIALSAGHLPFDAFLVQAGHPGTHTVLTAMGVATNVALNLVLVPLFAGFGAAVATASAVCLSAVYLEVSIRWKLNFELTPLTRDSR